MNIKIERIDRNTTYGVLDQATGKYRPKYDNCVDRWTPGLDNVSGMLLTGLTMEEEEILEKKLGFPEGHLSPNGAYWDTFQIIIPEEGLTLRVESDDIKKVRDYNSFIQYKALMACPLNAKSIEESKTNGKAEYVLTSETEKAKEANLKRNVIKEAWATYAKMTGATKAEALYMFGKPSEGVDPEVIDDELGSIVESNPAKFLTVVGDKNFKDKVWLIKLSKEGIIRKATTSPGFDQPLYFEDISLGHGLDNAVAFIRDKENQNVFIGLKKSYEAAVKVK